MSFFSKLIQNRTASGKLELSDAEKEVLLDLSRTGIVSFENNVVKLEKDISLVTEHNTLNNVYFCETLPFLDCYLYVFTAEKPVLLTKYNYTKRNKYNNKLDEINAKIFDKNKFVILMDYCTAPKNKQKIYIIKTVLATKNKNYLFEHTLDTETLFQTNVPFK